MPFAETWMNLEMIILSAVSQTEKDKHHMISVICGIKKKKNQKTERQTYSLGEGIHYEVVINISHYCIQNR